MLKYRIGFRELTSHTQIEICRGIYQAIWAELRSEEKRVFFNCRYAFFPRCFTVLDVYEVNNVCENEWVWVPGVVTWEYFLEALSERFRWVLGSCLNEVSSAVHLNK